MEVVTLRKVLSIGRDRGKKDDVSRSIRKPVLEE